MILPAQHIRARKGMIEPFEERGVASGMSYGLSCCGYDIRIYRGRILRPGDFALASTLERFAIPDDIMGHVADKSTWARRGLAVQNTILEPGWEGYLTIELSNHGGETLVIADGTPIAQIVFHQLLEPTEQPYRGKYDRQERGPVPARFE